MQLAWGIGRSYTRVQKEDGRELTLRNQAMWNLKLSRCSEILACVFWYLHLYIYLVEG